MVHTGISLNDRFTQMQSQAVKQSRPQRSRSQSRSRRIVNPNVSAANSRLLQEFKRKHTVQTALKLKRRSLRNSAGGGGGDSGASRGPRIGGVKPVRLGPNGRPMRSNNVTHVATMRADLVANARRRSNSSNRPSRSSSQVGGLRQRLGQRRSNVGGAAERVERRRQQQQQQQQPLGRRNRSRSRSRQAQPVRSRSQSRGRERSQSRPRSQSRNRFAGGRNAGGQRRGGAAAAARSSSSGRRVSVKQRLGVRPGQASAGSAAVGKDNRRVPRRGASKLRGVAGGRVEKRRNSSNQAQKGVSASLSGRGRQRGRSAAAAPGAGNSAAASTSRRSRSRTRAAVNAGLATPTNRPIGRGKVANKAANRNGNKNNNNSKRNKNSALVGKAKPRQQVAGAARRGRSRSRANRSDSGKAQPEVKREDLDNELDQYMSTTKSEMDYLLK
ncbi:uncharacterized protein Dwil_GK13464 [Drosophila willistoni]|uniref:Chromatin target of PRMT1 protein C-terminal domain-containing protein n=1 Tax=Drosophila willistoni TaxID=7260 RepID=B4NJ53_DROWI|nr:serine/arginine repetitive matrix protein 2 [Drosophila willistoni]EDW83846.2 uncharacterized protein Dwil_GK13464 [Drosophila willistoni]